MAYKHGVYGYITDSIVTSTKSADSVACAIGTAPIHLLGLSAAEQKELINTPIKLTSLSQAKQKIGWSEDFENFTLCEVVSQFFENPLGNVGPLYVINVLDPTMHIAPVTKTKTETLTTATTITITDPNIVSGSVTVTGKTNPADYTVAYTSSGATITFGTAQSADITYSYKTNTVQAITADEIIGKTNTDGSKTGMEALDLLYTKYNAVLNMLCAPGWSHLPKVYTAMCSKVQSLNGHWDGFVFADLPILADVENVETPVDTISKAIEWKKNNGYTSKFSKVYWPMAQDTTGRKIHLSTVGMAAQMAVDVENDSIPYESASNKEISIVDFYFGDASKNPGYDQVTANDLNEKGITTCCYWGGKWVLWGPHTAGYEYGKDADPMVYFETNMRMLEHVCNQFQIDHASKIDQPMTMELKNTILEQERDKIDHLKQIGALLGDDGTNTVDFLEDENSLNDMMNGDFVFNILATVTPPFKSGTAKITYTDTGLKALYEE